MLRSQVRIALEGDVYALRDDGAAMSSALHRLAALRATLYRDWSDGPASLVEFANQDRAAKRGHPLLTARSWASPDFAFAFDPAFPEMLPVADSPLDLRGRFDCLDEMPPPAAAEEEAPPELHVGAGAPVAWLLDLVQAPTQAKEEIGKTPVSNDADESNPPLLAVGAVADIFAWVMEPALQSTPAATVQSPHEDVIAEDVPLGAGAFANILEWLDAPVAAPAPESIAPPAENLDEDELYSIGAIIDCLALDAPVLEAAQPAPAPTPATVDEEEPAVAVGAFVGIFQLLDMAPPPEAFAPPPVVDLETVALDDALADACEALYVAALDPTEHYAWGASILAGDEPNAAALAACETALWSLPRTVTCAEVFALNPNHETAVKITRALRVRADTLQARAFTETLGFGALRTNEPFLPWFPSVETPDEPASDTLDADTEFSTWGQEEEAPRITAPDRPRPILSEAELDALLATPAAHDSHELDDSWQENPVWRDTFWHGVDAYLQSVEDCEFRRETIKAEPDSPAHPDIEIRDQSAATSAMHFWRPGDETDLAIDGEGYDLFLVGGDMTGVVLVEDGAMHAMRTGRGTRVGEVVVSWSDDLWTDIDGMGWTRVATLSGISDLRVEQNERHDRAVVISGELSGTALKADRVRLSEQTEDGPLDFPVRQVGGFGDSFEGDWPFSEQAGDGGGARLLI